MNTQIIAVGIIALAIGGFGGYALNNQPPMHTISDGSPMSGVSHDMHAEMDGMMASLEGKTGDEFDKAFLAEMIVHHEGAVEMAEAALENAKHEEIKSMANAIISAQTTEINQMKSWQAAWYGN
jgi:uncharacterized protein (DUF305 family)